MPPSEIHVIGVDPGGTTGWCRLTVPRMSMFGDEPSEIIEWDHGEFTGSEEGQVSSICRLVRETQSLAYGIGPAVVVEDWTIMPKNVTTNNGLLSPARIGAMLRYAKHRGDMGEDPHLIFQDRSLAKDHATDDRLKAWGLYIARSDHERDAARHAITALRRARRSAELRDQMWNRVHD